MGEFLSKGSPLLVNLLLFFFEWRRFGGDKAGNNKGGDGCDERFPRQLRRALSSEQKPHEQKDGDNEKPTQPVVPPRPPNINLLLANIEIPHLVVDSTDG